MERETDRRIGVAPTDYISRLAWERLEIPPEELVEVAVFSAEEDDEQTNKPPNYYITVTISCLPA